MGAVRLYTSTQIESEPRRAQLTRFVTQVLSRGYNMRIWGNLPEGDTLYVNAGQPGGYALWTISDNGGEFNVEKVNHSETLVSIPYIERGEIVDAGTVAYRIAMVIRGQKIAWDEYFPDLVDDFALAD